MTEFRIEIDSLGEIRVPADCLWGAQTQLVRAGRRKFTAMCRAPRKARPGVQFRNVIAGIGGFGELARDETSTLGDVITGNGATIFGLPS